jgi:hypothetical protein
MAAIAGTARAGDTFDRRINAHMVMSATGKSRSSRLETRGPAQGNVAATQISAGS